MPGGPPFTLSIWVQRRPTSQLTLLLTQHSKRPTCDLKQRRSALDTPLPDRLLHHALENQLPTCLAVVPGPRATAYELTTQEPTRQVTRLARSSCEAKHLVPGRLVQDLLRRFAAKSFGRPARRGSPDLRASQDVW